MKCILFLLNIFCLCPFLVKLLNAFERQNEKLLQITAFLLKTSHVIFDRDFIVNFLCRASRVLPHFRKMLGKRKGNVNLKKLEPFLINFKFIKIPKHKKYFKASTMRCLKDARSVGAVKKSEPSHELCFKLISNGTCNLSFFSSSIVSHSIVCHKQSHFFSRLMRCEEYNKKHEKKAHTVEAEKTQAQKQRIN